MHRELGKSVMGWAWGAFLVAVLVVALAAPAANATVRVFVTKSCDPYGLENDANAFTPTISIVYENGSSVNAYDYEDYYGNPGPLRPGAYPPANSPAGSCANPVAIEPPGQFAYVWLQFQNEPTGSQINGLQITIRECGSGEPTNNVDTTWYLCNNVEIYNNKRWDGTATPPNYPEWHNNPQTMVAVTAYGIKNQVAAYAPELWSGTGRIALLGAIEAPFDGTVYTIDITNISYASGYPPSVSGGAFAFGGGPPTGACCYLDGSCAVTTQAGCSGVWHPEWANCSVAQCPQPTAACCYPNGSCAVTTQAACTGVWHPEWANCSVAQCPQPTAACCYPDGGCAVTTQAGCTGIWHPEWANCSVAQCPQPSAACCYPDGSCVVTTQVACAGIWHPEWANCGVAQCPQPDVACCFPNGMCEMLTAAECTATGGTPEVYGSDCTPNECPACVGDVNCDGVVNFSDINPFVLILSDFASWQQTYAGCPWRNGDCDGNGGVGFEDINPFVSLIVQSPISCQE